MMGGWVIFQESDSHVGTVTGDIVQQQFTSGTTDGAVGKVGGNLTGADRAR